MRIRINISYGRKRRERSRHIRCLAMRNRIPSSWAACVMDLAPRRVSTWITATTYTIPWPGVISFWGKIFIVYLYSTPSITIHVKRQTLVFLESEHISFRIEFVSFLPIRSEMSYGEEFVFYPSKKSWSHRNIICLHITT